MTDVLGLRITMILTHLLVRAADGTRVNVNTAVSVSGRAAAGLEHSRKSKD
jgi:hypothetical protein